MEFLEDDDGEQKGPRTLFNVTACYGVNVKLFSQFPEEEEVGPCFASPGQPHSPLSGCSTSGVVPAVLFVCCGACAEVLAG